MLRFIAWSLLATYLAVVNFWPATAAPVEAVASGAFIVLAQPAVLLLVLLVGAVLSKRRRPAHVPARRH